jgi:peptide/nickel transport system permease protein
MGAYIIRRLLSVIPITLGVLLLTFLLFRAVGGNPAYRIAGKNATKERIEQITKARGLDKPLFLNFERFPRQLMDAQFPRMCWDLVRLDFGESQSTKQKVSTMLREGFMPSLSLMVPLFIIEEIMAITLALLAAYYRDSWLDRMFVVVSVAAMSISSLVYIMVAQYWLASQWRWFPVWGFEGPQYLLLPILIGVVAGIGGMVRFYRTVMLDEVNQDYVRTARAKGVSERSLLYRHVLRNAMIPILTNVVVAIPFLYTGSLLLESFFGIPGLGRMTVQALFNGDENVIIATVFIGSVLFVIANLVTDIAYTWADPRVRLK